MRLARLIASGFGSGFAPMAPGTAGSAAALLLGAGLMAISPIALALAAALACLVGLWSIDAADAAADPGWIVIDEFAGMWITMLALPAPSWLGLAAAFALFRLLDITKPGPVGWADRRHDALGIMGDDIIAGIMACAILFAVGHVFRLPWL